MTSLEARVRLLELENEPLRVNIWEDAASSLRRWRERQWEIERLRVIAKAAG